MAINGNGPFPERRDLVNDYDPDMYKPSHERIASSPLFKQLTQQSIDEEKQRQMLWNKKEAKKRGVKRVDFQNFVLFPLEEGLDGAESKKEHKLTMVVVFGGIALLILDLILFGPISNMTGLNFILVALILLVLDAIIMTKLISFFVNKSEQKRKNRAIKGGSTQVNIGKIWGINPGGVRTIINKGKENTVVKYTGKNTLIIKVLKDSVFTSSPNADWTHYEALEMIENIIASSGNNYSKINKRFDVENDPIWDVKADNIKKTKDMLGDKTQVCADLLNYHFNLTRDSHSVSTTYFLIQPRLINSGKSFEHMIEEIRQLLSQSQVILSEVTNKEYLKLLQDYYGLRYLDTEKISDYISDGMDVQEVSTTLVSYMDMTGNINKLEKDWVAPIPMRYKQEARVRKEKDIVEEEAIEIANESIYGDKHFKQREY